MDPASGQQILGALGLPALQAAQACHQLPLCLRVPQKLWLGRSPSEALIPKVMPHLPHLTCPSPARGRQAPRLTFSLSCQPGALQMPLLSPSHHPVGQSPASQKLRDAPHFPSRPPTATSA